VALDLSALPDEVRALIAMQAATIARLQAQLAKLRRMHFGRSSERLASSTAQLELALEDLEEQQALTCAVHRHHFNARNAISTACRRI
jgi:transposase